MTTKGGGVRMTPQEWLDAYDKDAIHPRTIYDERASTIIRDLLAEVERLRENIKQLQVQLAGCGVAAMCNTTQSRGQQKCVEGDYGWSQSYQDVVNAVGREIALRDQLQAVQALAATHLADQELLVARERKRVARECAEMCKPWGVADRIRTRYGVEE